MLLPIILLVVLLVIVLGANSMKTKGTMTEPTRQMIVSVASIVVTVAAVIALIVRLRG